MNALPRFSPDDYRTLLVSLTTAGYALVPVTAATDGKPVVHLRHDIDFFPGPAVTLARIEASVGARATYYVLLSGPYNVHAPEIRQELRTLVELGHEIGLHYDLETFPAGATAARAELDRQVEILAAATGAAVTTISTHQPHRGGDDPFRSLPGLVHPHDPDDKRPPVYISDSCRAWRDEALLACFRDDPPPRVMLLTHPELWLNGEVVDRQLYLGSVLVPAAVAPAERYYRDEVATIWRTHPGARAHDARATAPSTAVSTATAPDRSPTFHWPDRAWVENHLDAFQSRFSEFPELPWTGEQIMRDLPGKWENSLVASIPVAPGAVRPGHRDLLAFSFNSLRDGNIYINAFFVAPEARSHGLGSALLAAIHARAKQLGLSGVALRVDRNNPAGLRWWLGRGFRVTGLDPEGGAVVLAAPVRT